MIYIIANANAISGGPELLHQLCFFLNKNGYEASMVYFAKMKFGIAKPSEQLIERYGVYNCPVSTHIDDKKDNTVVFAEALLYFLPKFKKVKKVIWWQSVDNYYASMKHKYAKLYAPFGMKGEKYNPFNKDIVHCYQSYYAKMFLKENGVAESNTISLSDYLNDSIIQNSLGEEFKEKKNIVLYNPGKGYEFTKRLIEFDSDIKWIPLTGYTPAELAELMSTAKVYIDFGNHPGKDRMPREAAVNGCCILVGKRGSASNNVDMCISDKYKFEMESFDEKIITERIKECFDAYEYNRNEFVVYRERIKKEKDIFEGEVIQFGMRVCNSEL